MKAAQHPPTAPSPRPALAVSADQAQPLVRSMPGLRLRLKPKAMVDGMGVRLEGFHSQDQYVLRVTGSDGRRVTLLVVPPEAAVAAAHDAMLRAAGRGNTDRPVEILAAGGIVPDTTVRRMRLVSDHPRSSTTR